ncbi:MAG: NAD(P)-binding domain-containing protein, partial [Planctomycetota bacterium]
MFLQYWPLGLWFVTVRTFIAANTELEGEALFTAGFIGYSATAAAFGFDSEARAAAEVRESQRLTIGLVGFGNFGQFLAAKFVRQGHRVLATSRTDYSSRAAELGVEYFTDADDFAESHPDVVVLCTSILSTETVLSHRP